MSPRSGESRPADSVSTDAQPTAGATVALSSAGVTVLVDAPDGQPPAILHWGAELPGLSADVAVALRAARVTFVGTNGTNDPTRLTVLPEHHGGWAGRPGLSGSRGGPGWTPTFTITSIELDGQPVRGFVATGAGRLDVRGVDSELALQLELAIELLPSGLLRARAGVTNLDASDYHLHDLVLAFPVPSDVTELLDFGGRHNHERRPQRSHFGVGTHLRENRKGRTGFDSAFVLHAGTPGFTFATGEIYGVHVGFSGNHVHYAEQLYAGQRVIGGGELLLPDEIHLGAGASYTGPWVYGSYGVGLDAVAHRFHRFLRSRERPVSADRPVTLNVWEAVYFDHDLDRLLDLADRAAAVGVERFVLDDGWFGSRRDDHSGLGDWVVAGEVWPDGLHPLVNRLRELGMQFGLWFEPEMVNVDSDVARAHPDWIMSARSELPPEARFQQVLDLSNPGAYEHVKGQLLALLDEYDIAYLKWDHNRDLIEAGSPARRGLPAVHAQTLAFYRLLDELRGAHPELEIESCASGGGRVDLGVLERTDRVWVSDCIDPHERQAMLRWTGQLLPPEYLGSHIASGHSHTTGRTHDIGFRAGTAIFGHLGIEWDLTAATEVELAELREWVAFYKQERTLLLTGDLVRMDNADSNLAVHGVVSPDRSQALFAMATLDTSPGVIRELRLRGLDPARRYRLSPAVVGSPPAGLIPAQWWGEPEKGQYPGAVFTGAVLQHAGVASPHVFPDQVVLYRVQAVDADAPRPSRPADLP